MSEENKYLKLARAAREEGNAEDAKKFYDMARTDDPNNPEAKFFYQYYCLMDSTNGEIPSNFSKVCNTILPTLKLIAKLNCEEKEREKTTFEVIDAFLPLTDAMSHHMLGLSCFDYKDRHKLEEEGTETIANVSDELLTIFGEKQPYIDLAVKMWKERIDARHSLSRYRNYQDKGKKLWFDELAERIQKYDKDYVMPEFIQAGGCAVGAKAEEMNKVPAGK